MIWDMPLIRKVGRLYVLADLAAEQVAATGGMVVGMLHNRMADQLIDDAHPLGVEIDKRDIQFTEMEGNPARNTCKYRAQWSPMHGVVELLGGPLDGQVHTMEPSLITYAHPLVFPTLITRHDIWHPDPDGPAAPTVANMEYRMSGYREESRAWVYRYYL